MITALGKLQIKSYIAGLSPAVGQSIAIGIHTTPPSLSDNRMGFEVVRTPVTSVALDPVTNKIIFKGTLDQADLIRVSEIGLWSSSEARDSEMILEFDDFDESWEGTQHEFAESGSSRIGSSFMNMSVTDATAKAATYYIPTTDMSHILGPDDEWTVALNKTGSAALSVKLKLSSPEGSLEFNFFPSNTNATGYLFGNRPVKTAQSVGTFDPARVEQFDVTVTPAAGNATASTVQLDSVIATNAPSERDGSILVARSIITPAFTTSSTSATDVEYELEVSV